jgi:hypothetical protein
MYSVRPIGRIATSPFEHRVPDSRIGAPDNLARAEYSQVIGSELNIRDNGPPSQCFPITYHPALRRPRILDAGKCGYTHAQPPPLHFSGDLPDGAAADRDYLPPDVTKA